MLTDFEKSMLTDFLKLHSLCSRLLENERSQYRKSVTFRVNFGVNYRVNFRVNIQI